MCGRVRLVSDYSEIKIRLKFGSTAPAPNFKPSWNVPPTDPMLVATYAQGGERISQIMRWGLLPAGPKTSKLAIRPSMRVRIRSLRSLHFAAPGKGASVASSSPTVSTNGANPIGNPSRSVWRMMD